MCKITSLPNPHIYWVVIFVEVYVMILGIIILVLAALNLNQFGKVEGKLLPDSSINLVGIIFATLIILAGIVGIILVMLWKWQHIAAHAAVTLFIAVLLFIAGKSKIMLQTTYSPNFMQIGSPVFEKNNFS